MTSYKILLIVFYNFLYVVGIRKSDTLYFITFHKYDVQYQPEINKIDHAYHNLTTTLAHSPYQNVACTSAA